jgi:hypothetical protein
LLIVALLGCGAALGCGSSSTPAKNNNDGGGAGGATAGAGGTSGGGKGGTTTASGGASGQDAGAPDVPRPADAGAETSAAAADLGKACSADTDCGPGLQCLKATDKVLAGTGGPAGGYCTIPCTSDSTCAPLAGVCIDYKLNTTDPAEAYCFQTCVFGGTDRLSKCQGRTNVGCFFDNTSNTSACVPTCSQDSDCPAGRKCDPQFNLCMDTPTAGDPLGAHCTPDPNTGASSCAGVCLGIGSGTTPTATFCTTTCVLGELSGCGWVGKGMSVAGGTHGVCVFGSSNATAGDIGFCSVECDTVADCPDKIDPGPTCDTSQMSAIGHGACSWTGGAADGGRG